MCSFGLDCSLATGLQVHSLKTGILQSPGVLVSLGCQIDQHSPGLLWSYICSGVNECLQPNTRDGKGLGLRFRVALHSTLPDKVDGVGSAIWAVYNILSVLLLKASQAASYWQV